MRKFFGSSFFILTTIALLAGSVGAFLTGWFDVTPEPMERSGFLQFVDGVKMGAMSACVGLTPYWIYHSVIDDASHSWAEIDNKARRVIWVVCWAGFLGWIIPGIFLTLFYMT